MDEKMELVGRPANKELLETSLDEDSREHVFALKKEGKILAVARFLKLKEPHPCFYLRTIKSASKRQDEGNASILMNEVSELFQKSGDVCIAYKFTAVDEGDEEQFKKDKETEARVDALFEKSGWRNLPPPSQNIWALNLPADRDQDARDVITHLSKGVGL